VIQVLALVYVLMDVFGGAWIAKPLRLSRTTDNSFLLICKLQRRTKKPLTRRERELETVALCKWE
jgi:hypothetical protein